MSPAPPRFHGTRDLHFITFSCFERRPLLGTPRARTTFEQVLERVRQWYGMFITGYVVMPEHVHLLVGEPERSTLAVAIQMLKQNVARELGHAHPLPRFWQRRYYDFNVWTEQKRVEKLKYLHRNPVTRGLVRGRKTGHGAAFDTGQPGRRAWLRSSRSGQPENANEWDFSCL